MIMFDPYWALLERACKVVANNDPEMRSSTNCPFLPADVLSTGDLKVAQRSPKPQTLKGLGFRVLGFWV